MQLSIRKISCLLLLASFACEAREPTLYALGNGVDATQPQAAVKLQRSANSGAMLLLTFDGVDPRTFPSMAAYLARVRSAEAAMKPGQKPGLINRSPGRNEPQLVGVAPGKHTYGAMFMLIDTARPHLLGSGLAFAFEKKYLPENLENPDSKENAVTVKHYEELTFEAEAGGNYFIQYVWAPDTTDLKLIVQQCSPKWEDCKDIPFQSANPQTRVLPGVSDQEIAGKGDGKGAGGN